MDATASAARPLVFTDSFSQERVLESVRIDLLVDTQERRNPLCLPSLIASMFTITFCHLSM